MEARSKPNRWTYERFARIPREYGKRYEIIAGELVVTGAPRPMHQVVIARLMHPLMEFVNEHDLGLVIPGPIDVLFAEGDYVEPDLIFVRKNRREILSERAAESAPDLIIEVLSPSTAARDRGIKRERYALFRVPEYWVVDIEGKRIEVYRPDSGAEPSEIATGILRWRPLRDGPALEIKISELLADI